MVKRIGKNGLSHDDVKAFLDLCVKANGYQLIHMRVYVEEELNRRKNKTNLSFTSKALESSVGRGVEDA